MGNLQPLCEQRGRDFPRKEPKEQKAEPTKGEDKIKIGYSIWTINQAMPKANSISKIFNSERLLCSGKLESVFLFLFFCPEWPEFNHGIHWTWQGSHRVTGYWQVLDCYWEKRLGKSKVTGSVAGWTSGEADSEKEIWVREVSWGVLQRSGPIGEWRSSTGQREMVNGHAAGTTWHWYGLSESAPIRPTRRELSPWLGLVIVCRLPRTGAWSWSRCLSSIKCNSQRKSEPSGQSPTLPKLREEGWVWVWVEQHSGHKSWASGPSEWLWGHSCLQLKWGNKEEQMESGRTDFILNWWHLNTWEDVPRDPERHQSGNDGNENHSWWTPGKRECRSTETREDRTWGAPQKEKRTGEGKVSMAGETRINEKGNRFRQFCKFQNNSNNHKYVPGCKRLLYSMFFISVN